MTENAEPTPPVQTPAPAYDAPPPAPAYGSQAPAPAYGSQAPAYAGAPGHGPVGKIRGTGMCILLAIVTFGIYSAFWYYATHEEMKRHSGRGLGGAVALILALLVGFVMPYITSSEVGNLYEGTGKPKPVSGATGLWYFPGAFIIIGPLVWFIKTNGALNDYWRSQGAS